MRACLLLLGFSLALPSSALACGAISDAAPAPVIRASATPGAEPDAVTVTFLGHASFLIETPAGVTAVTDYNGHNIPDAPPDIATMNHAHSTHYTDDPDPRIRQVLHGWRDDDQRPDIDVTFRDLHIRNVPTNTREWGGGGTQVYGNSIFIFETAGLCIAHLSHLHHLLTPDDLAALGQIDVLMAPVDGYWTLSHHDILEVIDQIRAPLVIPMHYFTTDILDRFLDLARDRYDVKISTSPTTVISQANLPQHPEILVLPGGY